MSWMKKEEAAMERLSITTESPAVLMVLARILDKEGMDWAFAKKPNQTHMLMNAA